MTDARSSLSSETEMSRQAERARASDDGSVALDVLSLIAAGLMPDVEWTNAVSDTKLGPNVPALVLGFALTPAGTHRVKTATEMITGELRGGARIDDVLVDPGY